MSLVLVLVWAVGLYGLARFLPAVFPYVLAFSVLAGLNILPLVNDAVGELHRATLLGVLGAGLVLAGLLAFIRPVGVFVVVLLGLHVAGLLLPLHGLAQQVTGFSRLPPQKRFVCLQAADHEAQLYRVTQTRLHLSTLILAGKDRAGGPLLCASMPGGFPVLATYAIKPREQLKLQDDAVMQQYLEHPDVNRAHWTGYGTLGFVPSLRGTTYRFPLRIDEGKLTLPTGHFAQEEVEIVALTH